MRSTPLRSAKKAAWKAFSLWVRLSAADYRGYASCVSCGKMADWKTLQAGHFVPGRGNMILFDERGVFPQCAMCNIFKHGATLEYRDFMLKHYGKRGEKIIKELRENARKTKQFTIPELVAIREKYQERINGLENA